MDYLVEYFHEQIDCYHNIGLPDIILHMHNHFELYLFISGDCRYFVDGKAIELQQGHLLFLNNNQIHGPKVLSDAVYERISIHFSPKFARKLSSSQTSLLKPFEEGTGLTLLDRHDFAEMKSLMLQLTHEYREHSNYGHDLEVSSLLTRILLLSVKATHKENQNVQPHHFPELISELLQFIQENISDQNLSIDLIAQEFSHSGIYLNRLFKQELGSSIYQYILLSRISAAKKYLEAGENVQSSCLLSGFNDYSNFIRTFKKITGMTPKQYAKLFRIS